MDRTFLFVDSWGLFTLSGKSYHEGAFLGSFFRPCFRKNSNCQYMDNEHEFIFVKKIEIIGRVLVTEITWSVICVLPLQNPQISHNFYFFFFFEFFGKPRDIFQYFFWNSVMNFKVHFPVIHRGGQKLLFIRNSPKRPKVFNFKNIHSSRRFWKIFEFRPSLLLFWTIIFYFKYSHMFT